MLARNELERQENLPGRNNDPAFQAGDDTVTMLIPTLFEMSKTVMKMRCNLDKTGADDTMLDAFSNLESALVKMTIDVEYLRSKGH